MNIDLPGLEEKVERYMTAERFEHARRVRDTAVMLARRYGFDETKAGVAGLLHDVARDMPLEEMKLMVKNAGNVPDVLETASLLHASAGVVISRTEFGIEDKDILKSIELHTTGGMGMSMLDKIVFVADFIEPGRSFRGVKAARKTAFTDIDRTTFRILRFLLRHLVYRQKYICENTVFAYNEFAVRFKRQNNEN